MYVGGGDLKYVIGTLLNDTTSSCNMKCKLVQKPENILLKNKMKMLWKIMCGDGITPVLMVVTTICLPGNTYQRPLYIAVKKLYKKKKCKNSIFPTGCRKDKSCLISCLREGEKDGNK